MAGRWTDRVVTGANADGSVQTEPSTSAFYISNYIPLWAGLLEDSPGQAQQVVQSFLQSGVSLPVHHLSLVRMHANVVKVKSFWGWKICTMQLPGSLVQEPRF